MADKVTYSVSCTPQEELTDENSGSHYVMSGEVGRSLGGSGVATAASFGGTAAAQGYLNEVQTKIAIANGYIGELNTRIARDNQTYQWYASQIAALQQQYNTSFMVSGQQ